MDTAARTPSQGRARGASLGLPLSGPGSLASLADGRGLHDRLTGTAVVRER